jgi:hypothetical protein
VRPLTCWRDVADAVTQEDGAVTPDGPQLQVEDLGATAGGDADRLERVVARYLQ